MKPKKTLVAVGVSTPPEAFLSSNHVTDARVCTACRFEIWDVMSILQLCYTQPLSSSGGYNTHTVTYVKATCNARLYIAKKQRVCAMSDTLISRGSLRGERVIRRQWHVAARMKHVNKLVRNRRGQEGNSHHIRQEKKKIGRKDKPNRNTIINQHRSVLRTLKRKKKLLITSEMWFPRKWEHS